VDVEIVASEADELGEGPVWLPETSELLRVDIARGEVVVRGGVTGGGEARRGGVTGGGEARRDVAPERRRTLGAPVGFALPLAGGGLIAGVGRTLVRLATLDAHPVQIAAVEPTRPANRFNDAACDPRGRLWAGTLSTTREPGTAALYRVERGGEPVIAIAGVTVSNGLDWSPDATRLYYVDSVTQRIDAIDFDSDRGRLGARRPFAFIAPRDGLPDGLTVDADGGVWLALFGGGAIRRYLPTGALDAHIPVPVTHPTSLAFGGPEFADLYVTSACRDGSGGSLLRLRPGLRGRPATPFGAG
jgi:sugar lactone lactonase YvrE